MADATKGAAFVDASIAKRPRLTRVKQHSAAVKQLWREGLPPGDKTGWPSLDAYYTVLPGQFTVVTGWPGSGKSEWLDALLVNLSRRGWKFAIFSFENQPVAFHVNKMLEKLSGKPFGHGPTERMSEDEVDEYTNELHESFAFAAVQEGGCTLKDSLEEAGKFLAEFPDHKRGLVIDPWNELESWRPGHINETEYVSQALSMARNWARVNNAHVWIVAHPQKMRREDGKLPIPRPDMISGSQNWWNKGDACITVHRDFDKLESQDVDVYVQKMRFKHLGRPGFVTLKWDRITGRYHEPFAPKAIAMNEYRRAAGPA